MATTNLTINAGGTSRPMTADELAAYSQTVTDMQQEAAAQAEAEAATVAARASAHAKLAELGLTPDEIAALVGA